MNLALRQATKAEIIDHAQHDAIMAQAPEPESVESLDPEAMHYLSTWQGFGVTVSVGMAGVMDLRSMQSMGREGWLEREVVAYGDDPAPYRAVWSALDEWAFQSALASLNSAEGSGGN